MEIIRKNKSIVEYSEVGIGDVFIRIQDKEVYMEIEEGAVSLDNGYYYDIKDDEEVQVVRAKLYIQD